jgi:hypothetical protein
MPVLDFDVPDVLPVPEDGMLLPVPGAPVPDEPGCVVEPGCEADGAGEDFGVLLPEPVAGALPVPVL